MLMVGEKNGALMEELALQPVTQSQDQGQFQEIAPVSLLEPLSRMCADFEQCFQEFWSLAPRMRLFSISKNPHYYWHMEDFYVAQKGLDAQGKRWAQIRISEGLCQYLFETVLGKTLEEPDFSLPRIRNFEVFLLERFSRRLFQLISPKLLKSPGKKAPPPEQDELLHMVWVLAGEPDQVNQLILTAPQCCIKTKFEGIEAPQKWQIPDSRFLHAHTQVTFCLGRTTARLEELKQLEPDDIVVFEDSQADRWLLYDSVSGAWVPVAIKVPDTFKVPDLLIQQGQHAMANDMQIKQNIWDNLEVAVSATFNPVKMPLRQLKEMEQGLVVEVGDLMDNRVQIEVEGHPVAWGELLVVGDKFGVRIQGVLDGVESVDETSPGVTQTTQQPAGGAPGQAAPDTPVRSDELMDLDLDESDFDDLDDAEDWS